MVADTVAIMESNMVADMEVDIVATVNKEVHHHKFALADYTAMSFIFVNDTVSDVVESDVHQCQQYSDA